MMKLTELGLIMCAQCSHVWKPRVKRPRLCPRCSADYQPMEVLLPSEFDDVQVSELTYYDTSNLCTAIILWNKGVSDWRDYIPDLSS